MSIQSITADDFENFTLETNPARTFSSSSSTGVTGSVYLFARRSPTDLSHSAWKEVAPVANFQSSLFSDQYIDEFRQNILRLTGSSNVSSSVVTYMSAVYRQGVSAKLNQQLSIVRFTPPFSFNSNTLRKSVVINTLMPYYKTSYPTAQFNYSNYHCLNFYSSSNTPTASVLLYPNPTRSSGTLTQYGFTGSFSFDFWIKPKYPGDGSDAVGAYYRPGALFHLPGAYAVTLHSGSSVDVNGVRNAFRLLLQLTSSAVTRPDLVTTGSFAFFSDDNCLPINEWSHVTIRWGGTNYNFGTGSFVVNGRNRGSFVITSSFKAGDNSVYNSSVLCVGNFYSGSNSGLNALTYFFTDDTTTREGLYNLQSGTGFAPVSASAPDTFNYPLQAEVHELKIYEKYLNSNEISVLDTSGPLSTTGSLLFYLPPFFTQESPTRTVLNDLGGLPVNPFFSKNGTSTAPFAKDMAFGCGGHFINLENYTRDFVTGRFPRLWNLTSSVINRTSATPLDANTLIYSTGSNNKRLYTMLPCDNGKFLPNFNLLLPLSQGLFRNDLGNYEPGVISLRNLLTQSFPSNTNVQASGAIVDALVGGNSPDNLGAVPGSGLAIYHRTRDNTSNQVVFFDISNLFYGNQIKPGTFVIRDSSLSGSEDKVGVTIKDDGNGNLYRADVSQSQYPTWASIGNIFYNEGIVLLKSPQLYFFGQNQFNVEFSGTQNIHVLTINAYARPMQLITSSNPSYTTGALDDLANEPDKRYVFISTVHLHDDNLNVVGRTNVAQTILKRSGDKMLFKIKIDF